VTFVVSFVTREQAPTREGLMPAEQSAALRLTPREREILELVGEGLRNADVAAALRISPGTVRRHLENAYGKLGVHTRTAAVARLRRRDLLG
jgi:DNA-binding NarL/FixJ family response regulator